MDVVKNVKNKDETIDIFKNMITSYFLDSSNSPDEYKDVVEAIELLQQNPIYHKYIGMDSGYDKFKSDGELKKIFDFYDKCKKLITNI